MMQFIGRMLVWALLLGGGLPGRAQVLWQRAYGTAAANEDCSDLLPLRAGGYLLVGRQETPAQVFIIRTDARGDTLWTRKFRIRGFSGLYTGKACEDHAGRVLITGTGVPNPNVPSNSDAFLMLVDARARGDSLWTRKTAGPTADSYYDVALDANNNFFLSGNLVTRAQFLRVDAAGQVLQQVYTAFGVSSLVKVPGGFWAAAPNINTNLSRFYFIDDAGNIGQSKPCPIGSPHIYSMSLAEPGYILASGGRLGKFDLNMDTVWTRQVRYFQLLPTARLARVTTDNSYLVLGENYTPAGVELSVHKLDRQGRQLRDTLLQRGANTYAGGLAVDAANGSYVVAASAQQGPIGRSDIALAALRRWATVTAARPPHESTAGPLEAWPNPVASTAGLVTIRPPQAATGPVELRELTGRLVRRWPAEPTGRRRAERQLDLTGVASGFYLLTGLDASGRRYAARLIKE